MFRASVRRRGRLPLPGARADPPREPQSRPIYRERSSLCPVLRDFRERPRSYACGGLLERELFSAGGAATFSGRRDRVDDLAQRVGRARGRGPSGSFLPCQAGPGVWPRRLGRQNGSHGRAELEEITSLHRERPPIWCQHSEMLYSSQPGPGTSPGGDGVNGSALLQHGAHLDEDAVRKCSVIFDPSTE